MQGSYRIDRARVSLIGHSNGGFMAFRMACDHADQVAAIVSLNGASWNDTARCRLSEPVSVLAIHSSADETVEAAGVIGRVSRLLVNGEQVEGTVVPPAPPGAVVRVEAVIEG